MSPRAAVTRGLDLYRVGKLMITTRYRLDDINQAFDDLDSGNNIRGVVVFGQDGASPHVCIEKEDGSDG